jgi:intracellular sulfur oxidation DsrE/DsrF family protein
MNKDDNLSEEQLNAFVDGELASEEISILLNKTEQSAELDQRICKQRKLKEYIKHAYSEVPESTRPLSVRRIPDSLLGLALVATLLLVLGAVTGMLLHRYIEHEPMSGGYAAAVDSQRAVAVSENYILHVASGDPQKMKFALQEAKALLSSAGNGSQRKVEVVANEQGLDLLRSDVTQFKDEISYLASEKVIFYACSKTIQRLEEKGIVVKLVPEAIPGYTALDRVVLRMNEGWKYIKI